MFVFLSCIRHPDTSNNYKRIEELFETCAHAVCGQTNKNFIYIVVCNQIPEISFSDERIKFVEVNIEKPVGHRESVLMDRANKRLIGLTYANKFYEPEYIMMLDADDLVSRDLVEKIESNEKMKNTGGFRIDKGYLFDLKNQKWQRKYGMNRYCGSTLVFKYGQISEEFDIIDSIDTSEIISANSNKKNLLIKLLGDHIDSANFLENKGYPLLSYKKFGIAWVINTGENESRTKGKYSGVYADNKLLDLFSLDTTRSSKRNSIFDIIYEKYLFYKSYIAYKMSN